jgi:hypothetical protein
MKPSRETDIINMIFPIAIPLCGLQSVAGVRFKPPSTDAEAAAATLA